MLAKGKFYPQCLKRWWWIRNAHKRTYGRAHTHKYWHTPFVSEVRCFLTLKTRCKTKLLWLIMLSGTYGKIQRQVVYHHLRLCQQSSGRYMCDKNSGGIASLSCLSLFRPSCLLTATAWDVGNDAGETLAEQRTSTLSNSHGQITTWGQNQYKMVTLWTPCSELLFA